MEQIPWWQSQTLRALIIAGIAQAVQMLGLTETITTEILTLKVDQILDFVSLIATAWAAYARTTKANPPLTDKAAAKEVAVQKDLVKAAAAEAATNQGGFYTPFFVAVVGVLAALLLMVVSGCVVNPHKTAQSAEQQGDATYGELVIAKEQGAAILQDATVSDAVKRPIAQIIVDAKPVTDGLQDTLILYSQVKAEIASGASTQDKLTIVDKELAGWIAKAQPLISQLIKAIAGARK